MSQFVPHSDLDAEAAVVSACILVPEVFDEVSRFLKPEHFYSDANRRIFEAVDHLNRSQKTVDLVSIAGHLKQVGRLDQVGGTPYLAQVIDATPSVAHVEDHAKLVFDAWRKRTLLAVLQEKVVALRGDMTNEEIEAFVSNLSSAIETVAEGGTEETIFTARQLVAEEKAAIQSRVALKSAFTGIPCGLTELDQLLNGFKRKMKYTVAARPGNGKSGFLTTIGVNIATLGFGVVLISLEMPREQVIRRMICQKAGISVRDLENGKLDSEGWCRFNIGAGIIENLPIVVDEASSHNPSSIRSAVRRGLKKLRDEFPNIQLGLIGIDYIQICDGNEDEKKRSTREQEIAQISKASRRLAKEHNCPVVELSQLNREVEKRPDKRPILSDLKESGAIEADAYAVIMLYRDDYYRKPEETKDGLAEILVRKNRDGECGRALVSFHGPSASFFDLEEEHQTNFY
jgi:replicative DNA helicase